MNDEPLLLPRLEDPLRRIDARFEPYDPVFDAEEEPQVKTWPRKPRQIAAKAAAALGILLGCGEAGPPVQIFDPVVVELGPDAAPPVPEPSDADDDVEREDRDAAPNLWVAPDESPGSSEDDDADGSST